MNLRKFVVREYLNSGAVIIIACSRYEIMMTGNNFDELHAWGLDRVSNVEVPACHIVAIHAARETWFAFIVRVITGVIV